MLVVVVWAVAAADVVEAGLAEVVVELAVAAVGLEEEAADGAVDASDAADICF